MQQKIIRRPHVKPKLAKPWFDEFVMDMPSEVFSCLSEGIIQRSNFGHKFIESNTRLIFKIKDIRKANYLFARMDIDGAEVDGSSLLKSPPNEMHFSIRQRFVSHGHDSYQSNESTTRRRVSWHTAC